MNTLEAIRNQIDAGIDILRMIRQGRCPDVRTISKWVVVTADEYILPIMPPSQDKSRLEEIKSNYYNCQSILLPTMERDISFIITNLKISYDCLSASEKATSEDLDVKSCAGIEYDRLSNIYKYAEESFIPPLIGKEDGLTQKTALLNISGRIFQNIRSMLNLNRQTDFLTLSGCLRSILESFIDFHLILNNLIPSAVEKFFAHTNIHKLRTAKNILRLREQFGVDDSKSDNPIKGFLDAVDSGKIKVQYLWGKDKNGLGIMPSHWSEFDLISRMLKLKDLAVVPECIPECIDIYYYCNPYVHSSYTDFPRTEKDIDMLVWRIYKFAGDLIRELLKIMNTLMTVIDNEVLISKLTEIDKSNLIAYFGEHVKAGRSKS